MLANSARSGAEDSSRTEFERGQWGGADSSLEPGIEAPGSDSAGHGILLFPLAFRPLTSPGLGANGGLGFPDGRRPGPGLRRPGPFHELRHARRRGENGIP